MILNIVYQIFDKDKELFLYLNSKHAEWLDPIMLGLSSFPSWIAVCILIVIFMIYRGGVWRKAAPIALLLTIGCNSLLTNVIKHIVSRPRPLHIDLWSDIIHSIEKYEASYSFFSAHSSNSFSMAVFSLLFFQNKIYSCVIIAWALAVSYSRIYVGKHYPIDVVVGIAFGIVVGMFCYKVFEKYKVKRLKTES